MKIRTENTVHYTFGFSLTELLAAMVIGAMVMITSIGVYSRMRRSADEINRRIDTQQLPNEILQRIAEDLDRIVAPTSGKDADTKISITNKNDELYQSAQMKITKTYYDNKNSKQIFNEIVWQSNYDFDANGLILYRSHRGLTVEDKLLGEEKSKTNSELFIPVAAGLTYFKIEAHKGSGYADAWTADPLPKAVRITLSFAAPYKDINGNYSILESEMITRTVAIDRTRQIKFKFVPPDLNQLDINSFDVNSFDINDSNLYDYNDVNEPNLTDTRQ